MLHINYEQRVSTLKMMAQATSRVLAAHHVRLNSDVVGVQLRLTKEFHLHEAIQQRTQLWLSKKHGPEVDKEDWLPVNLRKRRFSTAAGAGESGAASAVDDMQNRDLYDALLDALKHFLQVQHRHLFFSDERISDLRSRRRLTVSWRLLRSELDGSIEGFDDSIKSAAGLQSVQQMLTTVVERIIEEEQIQLSAEYLHPSEPDAIEVHFREVGYSMTLSRLHQMMVTDDDKAKQQLEQQFGRLMTMHGLIVSHSQIFLRQKYELMQCKGSRCRLVDQIVCVEVGCTTCVECNQQLEILSRSTLAARDRRLCGLYTDCQTIALSSRGQTNTPDEIKQIEVQLTNARDVGQFVTGDHIEVNGILTARAGEGDQRFLTLLAHDIRHLDVTSVEHLLPKANIFRQEIAAVVSWWNIRRRSCLPAVNFSHDCLIFLLCRISIRIRFPF